MIAVIAVVFVVPAVLNASICVCASDANVPIYCNSVLVTEPSANLVASIPVANLALVTFAFLIFAVSTASSANLAVVTLAFSILAVVTASVANIAVTTLLAPIAVTPAFVMVTSPVGVTSVATLDALPK